jgi:hypothetical protein
MLLAWRGSTVDAATAPLIFVVSARRAIAVVTVVKFVFVVFIVHELPLR